jgi:hypothetical protein
MRVSLHPLALSLIGCTVASIESRHRVKRKTASEQQGTPDNQPISGPTDDSYYVGNLTVIFTSKIGK